MKRMRNGKRMLASILAVLMMLSLMPTTVFAAADDFSVIVTDSATAAPINGATVAFSNNDSDVLVSAVTDASGEAKFDSVQLETAVRCSVSANGYNTNVVDVPALNSPLSVQLTAAAPVEPDEPDEPVVEKVTVSGTVTDGSSPVAGASVSLAGADNRSTTTDDSGAFSFADVTKSGNYTLTVSKDGYKTATQAANLEGSNEIVLAAKESVVLSFAQESVSVAMGGTASNPVTNNGGRAVSYASDNTAVVTVDANGTLTPVSVGTATITASCAENDQYLASTGSYSVEVTKGTQTITFEKGTAPAITLKDIRAGESFVNTAKATSGTVTYSVVSGNELIESFDSATGSFKAIDYGKITVKATCKSDDYADASAEYTLTVKEPFDVTKTFTIKGTYGTNKPWYVTDLYVIPLPGVQYTFSYVNNEINTLLEVDPKKGTDELLVTNQTPDTLPEGTDPCTPDGILGLKGQEVEIYVHNKDGAVVKTKLEMLYKDSTVPEAKLKVEEKSEWTDKFLYIISFGKRADKETPAIMTVDAMDKHSSVQKIEYFIDEAYDVDTYQTLTYDQLDALKTWTVYEDGIEIDPEVWTGPGKEVETTKDAFFTAYAKVTDVAGNYAFFNSDGIILDTQVPSVELRQDDGSEEGAELEEDALYTEDVTLLVSADDLFSAEEGGEDSEGKADAGLKSVSYWITGSDMSFPEEEAGHSEDNAIVLFEAEDSEIDGETGVTAGDLVHAWKSSKDEEKILVEYATYEGHCASVFVKIVDRADNFVIYEQPLNFDATMPTMSVKFDGDPSGTKSDTVKYYNEARTITVTVVQYTRTFNPDNVKINITGPSVGDIQWRTEAGATEREDKQIAEIHFTKDGDYSFDVSYKYRGEEIKPTIIGNDKMTNTDPSFALDCTKPTGVLFPYNYSDWTWNGREKRTAYDGTFSDSGSGLQSVSYYVSDTRPSDKELDELPNNSWKAIKGNIQSAETEVCDVARGKVVTVKIVDKAGNVTYLSSVDTYAPQIVLTINQTPNENGYYNDTVTITANVTAGTGYIQSATYQVYFAGEKQGNAQNLNLYGSSGTITLEKGKYDNDEVTVRVTAKNSANSTSEESTDVMKIDTTGPAMTITASPAPSSKDSTYSYFNANTLKGQNLTVKFSVEEKAFDPTLMTAEVQTAVEGAVSLDESWKDSEDGKTHTKSARLTKDGIYTVAVGGKDLADNGLSVKGNIDEKIFIDTVYPTGTVTASAKHGKNVNFSATAADEAGGSGLDKVSYFRANGKLSTDELEKARWTDISPSMLGEDKTFTSIHDKGRYVMYIRVIDKAGNVSYFNSEDVVIDSDAPALTVTAPEANKAGFHIPVDGVVKVTVAVDDGSISAGLKDVSYQISGNGQTENGKLPVPAEGETPVTTLNGEIPVNADTFNADEVKVSVTATDNADNTTTREVTLKICVTAPTITVSFDNNTYSTDSYFQDVRKATVVVSCRPSAFKGIEPEDVIHVTGADLAGKNIPASISEWKQSGETFTATVDFPEGIFDFSASFTSLAELASTCSYAEGTAFPEHFTIDSTDPTGSLKFGELESVEKLLETVTFGLFSKEEVRLTAKASDTMSPITEVAYYQSHGDQAYDEAGLDGLDSSVWVVVSDLSDLDNIEIMTLPLDSRAVPYVRITDASGRYSYLMTEGAVADAKGSVITVAPTEEAEKTAVNDIYSDDVELAYSVKERADDETIDYAGITRVEWWTVVNDVDGKPIEVEGAPTEEDPEVLFDLYSADGEEAAPTEGHLTADQLKMVIEDKLSLVAKDNNSNDVEVYIRSVDNAGNTHEEMCKLKIDCTKPSADVAVGNGYSSADVGATITVKERNFDPKKVELTVTRNGQTITVTPTWTSKKGTGNGDDTTYTGKVSFAGDGAYAITKIKVTDMAGNVFEKSFTGADAKSFTVDKTVPVLTVAYDNNDVTNEKYYNAGRIATLTVTETNFDPTTSTVEIQATDNGNAIAAPALSAWTTAGDTHTATVNFEKDGHYTLRITIKDRAGNTTAQEEPDFYVDTTKPLVEISGVDDQSANNTQDKIGIVLTATDTNFDVFAPKVVSVVTDKDGKIVKSVVETGVITDIANGKVYTIDNLPDDGLYTVTVTVVDKAGNAYDTVTMIDADGNRTDVQKTAADTLLTFSVNRKGSAYDLDDNTHDLVGKYYVQHVYDDVVIIEVNADELEDYEITVNGKALTPGQDYEVEQSGGDGDWSKYIYTIPKELFEEEGEYNIVASSKDKAENSAFSDLKDAAVTFVVDRTAPIVTVSGMETGGRYQTERQTVTIIPTDDGGALASLFVALVNDNGETIKELINLSGKDLADAMELNDGIFTIELEEGLFQNVRIICKDCAVDADGNVNTYDESFTDVSVSSSGFMIFWANRPLRYGVIGGLIGLLLIFFLILLKRRKKDEEETTVQ